MSSTPSTPAPGSTSPSMLPTATLSPPTSADPTEGPSAPLGEAISRKQQMAIQRKLEKDQKKALKKEQQTKSAVAGLGQTQAGQGAMRFTKREWSEVPGLEGGRSKIRILSWNMLAQSLVRRELFPGSDMLKIKDRVPSLMQEFLHYQPDIGTLQEVDRLEEHLPSLTLSYGYTSYVGYPNKSHGLLIAHKAAVFEKVGERGLRLDELYLDRASSEEAEESVDPSSDEAKDRRRRRGLSRATRNVALLVGLRFKDGRSGGVIVGTTHLFWHPQHSYERARQTALLAREALAFRDSNEEWRDWPCFLAGDFNTQPVESTYALIKGVPLTANQVQDLKQSMVVHQSVDKFWDPNFITPQEAEAQEGTVDPTAETDPDKVLKNCRLATPSDGLPSVGDLTALFSRQEAGDVRSAYGEIGHKVQPGLDGSWYCQRNPAVEDGVKGRQEEDESVARSRLEGTDEDRIRRGDFELSYTNYTPLWRCSLDYIFLLPPSNLASSPKTQPRFTALLQSHEPKTMDPGLPRKGVCGSDHLAVGAEVQL